MNVLLLLLLSILSLLVAVVSVVIARRAVRRARSLAQHLEWQQLMLRLAKKRVETLECHRRLSRLK